MDPLPNHLEVVVASALPATAAELRSHLRLPANHGDDAELERLIGAAANWAERTYGISLATRTYRLDLDKPESVVELPHPPVSSIGEVRCKESGEFLAYETWGNRLILEGGKPKRPIAITYVAGHAEVPDDLKLAVLVHAAELWGQREATSDGVRYRNPYGLDALYRPHDTTIEVR